MNRSATGWGRNGSLPFRVVDERQAAKVSREFECIVIDTAAGPFAKTSRPSRGRRFSWALQVRLTLRKGKQGRPLRACQNGSPIHARSLDVPRILESTAGKGDIVRLPLPATCPDCGADMLVELAERDGIVVGRDQVPVGEEAPA